MNSIIEERETNINVDYYGKIVRVYSSHRATCVRLSRTLTSIEPKRYTVKGRLTALQFDIPFSDRENLKKVIKTNLLLGKIS